MPTYEHAALLQHKDQNGDMHIVYPVTKAENVDGLYESPALTGVPIAPTAESGTNTKQIATTEFVQTEISDLKKSVSDGKTAVANAITAKGVETATDATFAVMAENISNISSGTSSSAVGLNIFTQLDEPEIKDGIWVKTKNRYKNIIIDNSTLDDGGVWCDFTKPPVSSGKAVMYNGELHYIGGNKDGTYASNCHYKYDGESWTNINTLMQQNSGGSAVVNDGKIYLISGNTRFFAYGGDYSTNLIQIYDGKSWTRVNISLPVTSQVNRPAVVFNDLIYMILISGSNQFQYRFDGKSWSQIGATLGSCTGKASGAVPVSVVYNGKIHVFTETYHIAWNGTAWESVSTTPFSIENAASGNKALLFGGKLHVLHANSWSSSDLYRFDGGAWTKIASYAGWNIYSDVCVYQDTSIVVFGCGKRFVSSENVYEPYTLILQKGNSNSGAHATSILSTSFITGENNRFPSGFDDVWYFDDTSFDMDAEMYYGDGVQWVKFKN